LAKPEDPVPASGRDWAGPQLSPRKSLWSDPQALKFLEDSMAELVSAFLAANLNNKKISLKEIMWTFERKALFASLRLARGNQKDAAAILGIQATTLFEKMRKHGINGRCMKLSEKMRPLPPPG
jgi:DNA-binding NtrC family response regulator